MNKKRLFLSLALIFFAAFSFAKPKATLIQTPDRFFWEISGKDSKGNDSKVYIQGTIHIGTEDLYPLSENVQNAFDSADRYVSEISAEDIAKIQTEVQSRMLGSFQKANGRKLSDGLSEEETVNLKDVLTMVGTALSSEAVGAQLFNVYNTLEPWVSNSTISSLIIAACDYKAEYGLDMHFCSELAQNSKTWEGLDSLDTQLDLVSFGNYDEQLVILKSTLEQITKTDETKEEFKKIFDAYIKNDSGELDKLLAEESLNSIAENKSLAKKYIAAMYTDRNKAWAKKIATYLNDGGTTFVFAGCAHFLGKDSVFTYLKKNKTIK